MRRFHWIIVVLSFACAMSTAAQTVTLTLASPQNGDTVEPGATINWSIRFSVSGNDNAGLALLVVDLVQDANNPAFLDIPPATSVPTARSNFSSPAGVSNPGELNPITGYTGVQRGTPGRMNLIQIGGGQNNSGVALPPGSGVAENAVCVRGVGQPGPALLTAGHFTAPSVGGSYTFRLRNALANVFTEVNSPPALSPVVPAAVQGSGAVFSFTVAGPTCEACDVNCDQQVNSLDIQAFVNNLVQSSSPCSPCAGDANASGRLDASDIAAFVSCLLAG